MTKQHSARHSGITIRHTRSCASRDGAKCDCKPAFQAHVWDARSKQRIRKTFGSVSEAKQWRRDFGSALAKGTVKPPTKQTLDEAAEAWLAGTREGTIRNRSGDVYKPGVIREYERALQRRILPRLGHLKLSEVQRHHLQDLADRMLADGADPSTIRNALMPLRGIFRRALNRGDVAVNPTTGIELPAVRGRRERIASPDEASRLLDALPAGDRALWATALYAGLRRGELQGLRWEDVDLSTGLIHVRRSWDQLEGEIAPKSIAGTRKIPIASVLRRYLIEHKLSSSSDHVFPTAGGRPFDPGTISQRADRAWTAGELERITLHEARHTYASLMIAAGVNAKTLSTFMGHASITITLDRYGHLMPGSEDEAVGLLNAYLERASTRDSA
jgi:integrase